jgi:hypothetical protein
MVPCENLPCDDVSNDEDVLTVVAYSTVDFDLTVNHREEPPTTLGELDFAAFATTHPLPPDSKLGPLLRDGVTSTLKEGCLMVQHAGLTVDERQQMERALSPIHAKDGPDALWYESVVEHGAKRLSSKSLAVRRSGEMQIVATDVGGGWRAGGQMICEFLPYDCDGDVGMKRAQVALQLVRETMCTNRVLVWYGANGAVFEPRLANAMNAEDTYSSVLVASGRFTRRNDNLTFTSATGGFLITSDQVRLDSSTAAEVGKNIVCGYLDLPEIPRFTSPTERLRLRDGGTDSRDVLLIDAAGLSFDDQMRQSLLNLCSTAQRLVAVSLCAATGVDSTFIKRVAEVAPGTLRWIKVADRFIDGKDLRLVPASNRLTESRVHVDDADRRRLILKEARKYSHFFLTLMICAIVEDGDEASDDGAGE